MQCSIYAKKALTSFYVIALCKLCLNHQRTHLYSQQSTVAEGTVSFETAGGGSTILNDSLYSKLSTGRKIANQGAGGARIFLDLSSLEHGEYSKLCLTFLISRDSQCNPNNVDSKVSAIESNGTDFQVSVHRIVVSQPSLISPTIACSRAKMGCAASYGSGAIRRLWRRKRKYFPLPRCKTLNFQEVTSDLCQVGTVGSSRRGQRVCVGLL